MLILSTIKKIICTNPVLSVIYMIISFVFSIVTYLEIVITQHIVKELGNKNIKMIIGLTAILLFFYISRNIQGSLKQLLLSKIQLEISNIYYTKLYKRAYFDDLTKLDKADFLLDVKLARQAIESDIIKVFMIFTDIIGLTFSLCIVSTRIVKINPTFLILFLTMAFLQTLYVIKYSKSSVNIIKETAPLERKHQYFFTLLHRREYIKEIRSCKLNDWIEKKRHNEYSGIVEKQLNFSKKWLVINGAWTLIMYGFELLMYLYLLHYKIIGSIALDEMVFVIQSNSLFLQSVIAIIDYISELSQKSISIKAFDKLCGTEYEENDKKRICYDNDYILKIQDLSFSYNNKEVIKNINFNMKQGETIVVVGKNGSGKSTLVKIISGLLNMQKGKIDYSTDDISIVFQDYAKFKLSLRENIGFGDITFISDDLRIINNLKKADGIKILERFNDNLDVDLGKEFSDNTQDMSGGEWQKVAIARAMFKEGSLIIFDEPTAALDPFAEKEQMNLVKNMLDGKSMIIISHRIGISKLADRIIYLDEGCISELGTFDELMSKKGKFYKLFMQQSHWYENDIRV